MTNRTLLVTAPLPMTAGEWRLRLAELCRDCAVAEHEDEALYLGLAYDLLALAPDVPELEDLASHLPPRARIEALLEAGAHDTAAFAMMPERAGYILSRSAGGGTLATVLLDGMEDEMTSEGDSAAMALVSALAACLAAVADGIDSYRTMGPRPQLKPQIAPRVEVAHCGSWALDVAEWQVPEGTLLN